VRSEDRVCVALSSLDVHTTHSQLLARENPEATHGRVPQLSRGLPIARTLPARSEDPIRRGVVMGAEDRIRLALSSLDVHATHSQLLARDETEAANRRVPHLTLILAVTRTLPARAQHAKGRGVIVRSEDRVCVALSSLDVHTTHSQLLARENPEATHGRVPQLSRGLPIARTLPARSEDPIRRGVVMGAEDRIRLALSSLDVHATHSQLLARGDTHARVLSETLSLPHEAVGLRQVTCHAGKQSLLLRWLARRHTLPSRARRGVRRAGSRRLAAGLELLRCLLR